MSVDPADWFDLSDGELRARLIQRRIPPDQTDWLVANREQVPAIRAIERVLR